MSGKGRFRVKMTSDILRHSLFLANLRRDHINAQLNYRFLSGLASNAYGLLTSYRYAAENQNLLGNTGLCGFNNHFVGRMAAHIHSLAR